MLTTREFEKELAWRKGILEEFERELEDYTKRMIARKEEAKSKHGVVDAPSLPENGDLQRLVLYYVPQVDRSCLSYPQIANVNNYSEIHTRKRVKRAASRIDLDLRAAICTLAGPAAPESQLPTEQPAKKTRY